MKKLMAIFLAALVVLMSTAALAEDAQTEELYGELVVGSTTALSGSFFTEMWETIRRTSTFGCSCTDTT